MKIGWTADGRALHKRRMLNIIALATTMLAATPGDAGGIAAVDVQGDRVTVRFDDRVEGASAFLLDGPRRIALDVPGAQAGASGYAGSNAVVSGIRQGPVSYTHL